MGKDRSQEESRVADDVRKSIIRAAGGVLWRVGQDMVEIAVIHRPRYDDWTFPKGKLSSGESDMDGAVREVLEETGYRVTIGRPLGEVRYMKTQGGTTRPKVVRYWAMQADGGSFSKNREVDELRWVSVGEAEGLLSHPHDEELLKRFVSGPALTGTVLFVRHASAGDRDRWEGDDRERPLDDTGWHQAQELVRLLARFEVQQIVSADYRRCVQTVAPFAEAVGVPIDEDDLFSEDGYPAHEQEAIHLVRKLGESLTTTVVCSQGDVIPDLLTRLALEDHVDLPEPLPKKKGSVWVLTFDGPRLFSAEYFPPPRVEVE